MPIKMKPISVIKADLGINPGGAVHKFFTNTCYKKMDKYVPMDTGHLASNVSISLDGDKIIYESPYAHYMYIGELYVDSETGNPFAREHSTKIPTERALLYDTSKHPKAGPYWDKRMWSAEGQDVVKEVQDYINRRT